MSRFPIANLESLPTEGFPKSPLHGASSLSHFHSPTPSPKTDSREDVSPVFPEVDEIIPDISMKNLRISQALKFNKVKSGIKIPSSKKLPSMTDIKRKILRFDGLSKIAEINRGVTQDSMKESTESKLSDNNHQSIMFKSNLSLRLWESTESTIDENAFIRKLKRTPKTLEDAKFIYNCITQFPFFQKFQEQNLQNSVDEAFFHVCRYCDYEKHPKNSIIFKEGDRSNEKFYIVISGTVHIYLQDKSVFMQENLEKSQVEVPVIEKSALRRKSSLYTSPKIINNDAFVKKKGSVMTASFSHHFQKHVFEADSSKARFFDPKNLPEIGTKRNELGPGEAFGEKALLINEPELAKRTATIVAATDVEFMIIRKMEFDRIIQRFSKQNEKKVDFLKKTLPFLNSIHSISTLENLVYSFKEETIGINMTVTQENDYDFAEKIYFVHEGLCRVEKTHNFFMNGISHSLNCNVCDLGEGSLIGEEIIFKEKIKKLETFNQYSYTVVVISENAKFYVITKQDFLLKFPKEIRNFLFEKFLLKEKSRKEIFLKNSKEQIKRYQEVQLQTLIQTNLLKNKDLLKNMSVNMKKNYLEKVKGLADELAREEYNPITIHPSSQNTKRYHTSQSERNRTQNWENENKNEPFSIIESLKVQAKLKEMRKTLRLKQQEILKNPEEIEEFFKIHDQNYLIRNSTSQRNRSSENELDENQVKSTRAAMKTLEICEKLDFGNGVEDEKLEKMQRIKLGLFKPENPQFLHFDIVGHMSTETQKNKLFNIKRLGSIDSSSVQILKCLGSESTALLSERSIRSHGNSSHEIRKGVMLAKFQKTTEKRNFEGLGVGEKVEKKEKDFNFYKRLKAKGENYNKLFGRRKLFS